MARLSLLSLIALAFSAEAFVVPSRSFVAQRTGALWMSDDNQSTTERGVSIDQDGKSNVWAIEPKVEVETKSAEEKTKNALVAGAGGVAFIAAAAVILTNLPDPNSF
mmetsp:Transcript_43034/g.100966  ORF Transcript_43034/g.100966 Transcript_43034/m.100966 type:complete len:107 (-) Transcript_43034:272-592(-)|eukprot:CAMPEP_0113313440 /NCGR_PEP_ID=MMETSP0010_2-20120614/9865_1 /TAXON_ID=216773 ORGANISM="Corethron hystrix, Strain 308" /NCGR_SAMPLE_ID=MMETSP0010_2 /ASSEMBLY_ACC=CAM_ASM_000155 /LENGTH=106 /DNA_ID=CAMNT_0000169457 /DNA_START=157 /DNA_END=477 /DNA_ORIENTATION=+ /assembly_acc=CAM_ASM_000155